jgi:hypothetical protein
MKKAALALAAVLALVLTASALGDDFSQGKGAKAAPNWTVLTTGDNGFKRKPAQAFADGIGFAFGTAPDDTRLFVTSHPGSGMLGDLTGGKTLTATFTITGTATAFTYRGAGNPDFDGQCGAPTPPSVHLYFDGNAPPWTGDFQQWFSPQAHTLTSLVGTTLTLTVPLDPAYWANKRGVPASDLSTYFAASLADVGAVGFAFGGGCFAGIGAWPTDGTASFVLKSYSVS